MRAFLCPLAQGGCLEKITLEHTQTIFQALFTFGIAITLLIRMRNLVQGALESVEKRTLQVLSGGIAKHPPELVERVNSVCAAWKPYFDLPVRWTFRAVLICFYGTAIVAGTMITLTLVSGNIVLGFNHPTSVAFALAPFVAVLLFFGDRVLCERGIHVALAPEAAIRSSTLDLRRTSVADRIAQEAEAMRRKREGEPGKEDPTATP
jgi:hypothetical protein